MSASRRYYRRSPDQLSQEEIQQYLLHLIEERKLAWSSTNQAACALRFFFHVTLKQPAATFVIPARKAPTKLPEILSREEVDRILASCINLKHRTMLMTTYAAGLRVSETCKLTVIALRRHNWVVYAKQPIGGPTEVLDYLARYTHRVAISNERLISLHQGQVAFRVRDNANPGKKRVERLSAESFIARFLQHVLPQGFKRIRHYGLLASCHKRKKLAACRLALHAPEPDPAVIETVDAFMQRVAHVNITRCPHCTSGVMQVIEEIAPKRIIMPLTTGPPS